jgi:sulfur relay (sulfurtransferase) complex TusBCD TusD component (DsrE family)
MKINVLLTTSPELENSNTVLNLINAAIDLGHESTIFFMDDGVYNVVKGNHISSKFAQLRDKGASLALCGHTAEERGVKKEDCIDGVAFAGQYELAVLINESDRFLTFGG